MPSTDKVIDVDVENEGLNIHFNSILDLNGLSQNVHRSAHSLNHTLDLVLTCGFESKQLTVFPHNPDLSDHF